ncbi:MAG: hypothetical protein E7398_01635 [Ruminococcaceae bacterium]|nr:hypothetical protein [Oscillospiraceae bacterium]
MKGKKYYFIFVFVLLAIIYIIRAFVNGNVVKDTLYKDTVEDSVNTKAMVIKYENLYSSDIDGVLDAKFESGDRVASGSQIAVTYNGSVDPRVKIKLEQINKKISILESRHNENTAFSNDISKLEQEISSDLTKIIDESYKKNMSSVSLLKYSITALTEHKATIEGNTQAVSSTLDTLKSSKAELEAQIGAAESSIYARNSGIFSSYIDGLEELITPYNMHELTPSKFDELQTFDETNVRENKTSNGVYACKIIDNYRYFIAITLDEAQLSGTKVGDNIKLRFYDVSPKSSTAKVFHISPAQDGRYVVICECRNYQEGLLEQRFVNVDFVKKTYSGYKISLSALRTKGNENGVYVLRENIVTFVPVNIVYNENDTLIVSSASEENPLKLYDEIIVNSPDVEEGQMVNS